MNPEEIRLTTSRIELAALAWGDADAPPVLALHGWLDNAASFVPMARHLMTGSDIRRFVSIDMAGHGASGHRPDGYHYYFVDYVADFINAVDALGLRQFDLVAHSLGGAVATLVASLIPDRVRRLVLVEALGPLTRDAGKAPQDMEKGLAQMQQYEARQGMRKLAVYPDPEVAIQARLKAGDISEAAARMLVMRNMREVDGGWSWRSDPRLKQRSLMYLTEEQVLAHIRRITSPTLLVRGTESGFAERDSMVMRQGALKNLAIEDLPGQHHLHMDSPQPVSELVMGFLTR